MHFGNPKGARRDFCSDKEIRVVGDKKNKIITPGWMNYFREDDSKELSQGKFFLINGDY
jgi:hypothetical protein